MTEETTAQYTENLFTVQWSPEEELHRKFQLLTRQQNLWKSRYCERCEKTGERGTFIGINYFSQGEIGRAHV